MRGWLVVLICLFCPWQLYLLAGPVGSVSLVQFALAPLLAFLIVHAALRPRERMLPSHAPFVLLVAFACLCLVGALWAPDRVLALKTFVKVAGVVVICVAVASSSRRARNRAVGALAVSAAILAVMIVVFRIWPLLENGFLFSRAATLTVDPDLLGDLLEGTERANVLADDRAGGVFTNANVAGLFLGIVFFLVQAGRLSRRRTLALSLPLLAGIVATGSKSALVALLVTGTLWVAITMRGRLRLSTASLLLAGVLVAVPMLGLYIIRLRLWEAAGTAFGSRLEVWRAAVVELGQNPLLGLGFGGWEKYIDETRPFEGVFVRYPLHNLLLIAWSWLGIVGATVAAGFLVTAIRAPLRRHLPERGLNRLTAIALSLAFVWFLIQSMFTNAAVTDIRIGIPLGVALGLITPAHAEGASDIISHRPQ